MPSSFNANGVLNIHTMVRLSFFNITLAGRTFSYEQKLQRRKRENIEF
jgi:hypothetical protein